jgi:CubicO group peptidase (beta-lactamase class C family)
VTHDPPFDRVPVDDPTSLGVNMDALADLVGRAQRCIDDGTTPSCQIAIAREGRIAVSLALGDATTDSRYVIFSATKPVVAGAIWVLIGDGELDISRRVVDLVPEFGTNGKDVITIEQVLLHTSGFPHAPFQATQWDDRDARLARFAQWRCNWEPGTRYEYHPTSAHWVLAELIERVTGGDFRDFIRTRITEPLGLTDLEVGVPLERQANIKDLELRGEPTTREELLAAIGLESLPITEVTPAALMSFNRPEMRKVGVPGGGGASTATDLALYYQALLHNPVSTWKPDVLADVTSHVRNTMVDYLGAPANRTIGLVIAGDDGKSHIRGMGHTVSGPTFGHNGAGGQIAWADPTTGVSFCYLTNGLDQHQLREWRRTSALASRAGVCV